MSDNLVLELLRAIHGDISELKSEQREQRGRLAAIEQSLSHIERDGAEQRAEIGGRFDRLLDRLEKIERRLDLRDA